MKSWTLSLKEVKNLNFKLRYCYSFNFYEIEFNDVINMLNKFYFIMTDLAKTNCKKYHNEIIIRYSAGKQ